VDFFFQVGKTFNKHHIAFIFGIIMSFKNSIIKTSVGNMFDHFNKFIDCIFINPPQCKNLPKNKVSGLHFNAIIWKIKMQIYTFSHSSCLNLQLTQGFVEYSKPLIHKMFVAYQSPQYDFAIMRLEIWRASPPTPPIWAYIIVTTSNIFLLIISPSPLINMK